MDGDVSGVRINPSLIEYRDAYVGKLYSADITVKNISKTSKEIRYYAPQSKYFKLKVKNPKKPVAPGLEVSAVVEYISTEGLEHKDRLVVTVDGDVLEVPLLGVPCRPNLVIQGPVDFGSVVASSKVISKEIFIHNHGSREGEFKLKYCGDKPIAIIPSCGRVPAKSSQSIKIEFVTKASGKFEEVVKVKLEDKETQVLHVRGDIVDGSLELLTCDGSEQLMSCVDFGATYYGTDQTHVGLLYNNGPEPVCFIAVLQEDIVGQEVSTVSNSGGKMNPLTSLVTAIPNQGMLAPYEKIPIFFRFSPRWSKDGQGFHCSEQPAPTQQFALFMHFKVVGASEGFQDTDSKPKSNVEGSVLEVALTGTALAVLVSVSPLSKFDFGECPVGQHVDTLCRLNNDSTLMSAKFQFRRVAHFTAKPASGKIKPGQSQDIIFSFSPHQAGTFKPSQYVDIMGMVADERNPFSTNPEVIHSLIIQLLGQSDPITIKKKPVFNPGITPKISNEVGMYVDTTFATSEDKPRNALLQSQGTNLHSSRKLNVDGEKTNDKVLVAYPNDLARSIRPSDRTLQFQTLFTRKDRHNYVDPDYSFTNKEIETVLKHKADYLQFIDELRENRHNKQRNIEYKEHSNKKDIGIKPAAGLKPRKILIEEVGPDPPSPRPPNEPFKLLSSKQLAKMELDSAKNVRDGLNAVPTTAVEKSDCAKILSPKELHQVVIGPPTIDFGEVCLKSVSQKEINILNNLDQYIHVVVHIDCRELRQTSPLSQVVPPKCRVALPLIFESNTKGRFQRSVDYTINGFYKNHLTVFSEVVPVALQLSTDDLLLEPQLGLPADAGIRGVITVYNKLNYPAEFTWTPILGDRGTAFSIRPATGIVEPFTDLDCEVVFHPSYMAPEEGHFSLQVHGGSTLKLKCAAKLGATNVQFIDRRIMFGQVPLHMTTTRIAMLKNTSLNHAYFQVLDPNPFPGLTISPIHGVVPVGGTSQLQIHLTPNAVIKFDTRINISIRGWKSLELRLGGTVEPPVVEIDMPSFNLGGVYCGSSHTQSFKLINKVHTRARVEFDLSRYPDFLLDFPSHQTSEDYTYQLMNPGMYCVTLAAAETLECSLTFKPTEVASYDFIIPVTINQTGAPTPSPTPFPPTPAPSNKNSVQHIINPRPVHVTIATPRRKVMATALRQPLQLSHLALEFSMTPRMHELSTAAVSGQNQGTLLVNNSDQELKWAIDVSKGNQILEQGVFKFLHSSGMPYMTHGDGGVEGVLAPGKTITLAVTFCPDKPGHYEVTLPVVINDDYSRPYQYLSLKGELKSPHLWFDPLAIVLTPVPLQMDISSEFKILAANYHKKSSISVEPLTVECGDGSTITPLSFTFPNGTAIKPHSGDEEDDEPVVIMCRVNFKSPKPISFTEHIRIVDDLGNTFRLPLSATADNCLMTCYPFLAQHRADHQIVCEQGRALRGRRTASRESMNVGEAVLLPCTSPPRPGSRPSTTATSSNFEISSSSYEDSSQSVTESNYPSTPRDGALNKFTTESEQQSRGGRNDLQSRSLGSALFPEEDTEEGVFHTEVLLAVQRWFSSQGWPGGPNPIVVPDSLRGGISKKPNEEAAKTAKGASFESSGMKKEVRTVYDMISHLCGKTVPGIPINNPLPADPIERSKQIYWQHSTLLTFLRAQGACITSIKPEYLMEPSDYKSWVKLQKDLEAKRNKTAGRRSLRMKTEEEEAIEEQLFEAVSKRAWVDILLQLLKTVCLSRITPRQFKNLPTPYKNSTMPMVDPDPLCSNVYSIAERILLLWLNHNYEQQRKVIWQDSIKGGTPPSRWVVNFDFDLLDGLVLAAILGAHVPFLVDAYLSDMYTHPATAEQCLHNALRVVNAMRAIGVDYDIQAIDITDPNPISLLLLCVHLYNNLPQYIPRSSVEFVGGLHVTVLRQVRLTNPSTKPLTYHALLAGRDAKDFHLPKGESVVLTPKSHVNLLLEFTSRFLRPAEAVLVLVGRRQGSSVGSTLVFTLRSHVDNIIPKTVVKVESPCYDLHSVSIEVMNPFQTAGMFKVVLVESKNKMASLNGSTPKDSNTIPAHKKKSKKIRSKIDHGQQVAESPEAEDETSAEMLTQQIDMQKRQEEENDAMMSAFSAQDKEIFLEACEQGVVDINFLPFQPGKRHCSLIFVNDEVGEFVYEVDATATEPLPGNLPFKPTQHSVRISSAAAIGGSRGSALTGMEDNIVFWKCECGRTLDEKLSVPVVNEAKAKALILAATQQMSRTELERRKVTGTLESTSLSQKAVSLLTSNPANSTTKVNQRPQSTTFNVELDSKLFSAPSTLVVPGNAKDGACMDLPISFNARDAGHYTCKVTLKSPDDVRVYFIDCTVVPEGNEAHLDFSTPVHQSITQNIPVVNNTNHDWPMEADLTGACFTGPFTIMAKAQSTTQYPLVFRPSYEGEISGKLTLTNTADGVVNTFHLVGKGQKPLPLEQITVHCEAKQSKSLILQVPNITTKKLHYRAESDLSFLSGVDVTSVLPGQTGTYEMTLTPLRRGHFKGVLAFVAGSSPLQELDSDGDEIDSMSKNDPLNGYRVWYSLDIHVSRPPPQSALTISCACQKQAVIEIGVTNPTKLDLSLEAKVKGQSLTGPDSITLEPKARGVYKLQFCPAIVGATKGSVVFFHEAVGEFWYDLTLIAEKPMPVTLPPMECEIGRWARQHITLRNPTDETLILIPMVSNTNNFVLERENEQPLELQPHSTIHLPVTFMPSTLGEGDHQARISFHCPQLGEWVYFVNGRGLLPHPQDPVSITAVAGSNATLILPFRNPLDIAVVASVTMKDVQAETAAALDQPASTLGQSPFCMLLKPSTLRLGPKSTIDIPLSFAPEDMKKFEAEVTVSVGREDGGSWETKPASDAEGESWEVKEVKWVYPIHGYPELTQANDLPPVTIECQARDRMEERLEVTLSGVAPSASGPKRGIKARAVTPNNEAPRVPDGVVVGETMALAEEFTYELVYGNSQSHGDLDPTVVLKLLRQHRDKDTGLVVLIFNIIYAPYKAMSHDVHLLVQGATGGMWRFPLKFVSTEPEPDDLVIIEAAGLDQCSSVGFRLTSQTKDPVAYNAYFVADSDSEFSVSPQSGELLPEGTAGTLLKVTFTPGKYGKIYMAKLVVQAPDMQWIYNIRGVLPEYNPPRGMSSHPMAGPHPDPRRRGEKVNYIRENLRLNTTAVSSPLKGAPVIPKRRPTVNIS